MGARKNFIEKYISEQYGGTVAYMFANAPDVGICRHGEKGKWYAVFMKVEYRKLGLDKDGSTDILDLKCDPMLAAALCNGTTIFPGYHMNKTHWITITLDGRADEEETMSLVDLSYRLTLPKIKKNGNAGNVSVR